MASLRRKESIRANVAILALSVVTTVFLIGCSLGKSTRHGDLILVKKKRTVALKAEPSETWLLKTEWIPLNESGTVILQTQNLPPNIVVGEFQLQFRGRDFLKPMERAKSAVIDIAITDDSGKNIYSKTHSLALLNWIHQRGKNIAFADVEEMEEALTDHRNYRIQISISKPAPEFNGRFRITGKRAVWNTDQ